MSANTGPKTMTPHPNGTNDVLLFSGAFTSRLPLPFFSGGIQAGVPHEAQNFPGELIDFNERFIRHPDATFYARVDTDALQAVGVMRGDLVVVDRAETPQHGDLVVYYAEGAFRIGAVDFSHKQEGRVLLRQADPAARVFEFQADSFQEWGVVVCSIRRRT